MSRRYSRLVRFLRLTLPLLAVGLIGLLFAWPQVEDSLPLMQETAGIPRTMGTNELINPRFESIDSENRPFTITATRAVQSARDPSVILMDTPMADITLQDGIWIAVEAARGAYRQDAENILLEGVVTLFHDDGYELKTERLQVDLKQGQAFSDQPVSAQGPAGTLQASGLRAEAGGGHLVFTGPVRLVLNRKIDGI